MRNIILILKHEFLTTIRKPSFWLTTFLLPGIIIVMNLGSQIVAEDAFDGSDELLPGVNVGLGEESTPAEFTPPVIGYVDEAGIIDRLPPDIPPTLLQSFASETAAQAALSEAAIDQYYLIPASFQETGEVFMVSQDFQPFNVNTDSLFQYVLTYGVTGDPQTAAIFVDPDFAVFPHRVAPQDAAAAANAANPLTFFVPFAVLFIFFFLITMSSGFMLQSVSREKENRTAEVLLVSLRPRELMLGKVLGLSLVAMLQLGFWFGGGLLALEQGRQIFETIGTFTLPDGFLVWGIGFFVLGYLLYASLMGAVGALAPSAREGSQFTFVILLPLMLPLWLNFAFLEAPNGTLATALSLIPLTAPVSMMTRMAATSVPVWQILLSLGGLAITTYLLILLAARFFRADTLLSNAPLQWQRFVAELRRA